MDRSIESDVLSALVRDPDVGNLGQTGRYNLLCWDVKSTTDFLHISCNTWKMVYYPEGKMKFITLATSFEEIVKLFSDPEFRKAHNLDKTNP